ncbi:flagellar brake protein [Bacterioplanoides sp.]|uniref:flagellar brake protein n=1 Tax=Bacterioplanoides sp. TaxID=2066072 RepID=UPI003B00D097
MAQESNQEYILTAPEDIYGALRKIVVMETPVQIRIESQQHTFRSAITQTDLKSRSFFMDQVTPEEGNDLIRQGNRYSVECDSQGVRIEFKVTGRMKYSAAKEQYRVEFPESLLYLQRRTAYRVMVPPAHNIRLKVQMPDDEGNILGTLQDLSSSGFRVKINGNVKKRLEEIRNFPVAKVRFNQEHYMDCSLEARHVILDDQGNTHCGFAFTSVSATAQRYIDRLITEFQWEERRLKEQQESEIGDV